MHPIKKFTIADGYTDMIVDLKTSTGIYLRDKLTGNTYLDFFSFYASSPLGFNHPKMINDLEFLDHLQHAALNKVSNSDFYTEEYSHFVDVFGRIAVPENFKHLFFISGGTLAVENTLKAAFDWKVKKNFASSINKETGSQVIHFKQAFHGRSGYTLSLTNTADPRKYQYFPKFDWPRINNPKVTFPLENHLEDVVASEKESIDQISEAISSNPNDIAAIILEPIQGEGGDNHFRPEFFHKLRKIADDNEIMLIFDEVQTGIGLTGKMWGYEHYGVEPDLIAFGKKTQVCGMMSTTRIDEIENNVFKESSRINSTWGGSLVDMVRSSRILEIIDEDHLVDNVAKMGEYLSKYMLDLQDDTTNITNFRAKGLFAAFDLADTNTRDQLKKNLYKDKLMLLGSGVKSIRFRPPLIVNQNQIDDMMEILEKNVRSL